MEGLDYVNPKYLRTLTSVEAGDAVAVGDISDDARHMAALDELDSVAYRLEGDPEASTRVWLPKEISLGQNVLRPALGMFVDGAGDYKFHLIHFLGVRGDGTIVGVTDKQELSGGVLSLTTTAGFPIDILRRVQQKFLDTVKGKDDKYWGWRTQVAPFVR